LVRLIRVTNELDPLTPDLVTGLPPANITRLEWEEAQATPFEMELETLVVRGNIVPATAGETLESFFEIEANPQALILPPPQPPHLPATNTYYNETFSSYAVERSALLFTLPGSEERDVVSHGRNLEHAAPEARVMDGTLMGGVWVTASEWEWKRSLLGVSSSSPSDKHFTLDDGAWRRVAGYRRVDETETVQEFVHFDYANGRGATVQFGNGEFGETPTRDMNLRVVYRLGHGRGDNVAIDSLTDFDQVTLPFVTAVTNPFGVIDAIDPETADEVRHIAPQAFRAETFRAVRAEDYVAAVEKLDWVQRAGAQFRWTGSWLTLFATPDPKGSFFLTVAERSDLERQLDRYRLAARETHGMNPKFANLDLEVHICVAPSSYKGEVKEAVLEALFGKRDVRAHPGFFSPDNWTFGDPLMRARLEATIQEVPGVRAVEQIYIRRRGWFAKQLFDELVYSVAADEIIRVENDPEKPERGAVRLVMEGGA
jgi:predicted phage baseplate assembly protein